MPKPVAVLLLNRNLGDLTDRLVEHLQKFDHDVADFFVIESGSEPAKSSHHATWRADWPEAVEHGLRLARGFNFGLANLLAEKRYEGYDYYFLVCNDSVFTPGPTITLLLEEMVSHARIGILSPCDQTWGEFRMIPDGGVRLFWYGTHIAWMMRRSFIDLVREVESPTYMNFLYDGSNFRSYYLDVELIGKAYANSYCYAVTRKVLFHEAANLKDRYSYIMRTDGTEVNQDKMFREGVAWLRRKYGFQSHWNMLRYVKGFYDLFLENYPEYLRFKI